MREPQGKFYRFLHPIAHLMIILVIATKINNENAQNPVLNMMNGTNMTADDSGIYDSKSISHHRHNPWMDTPTCWHLCILYCQLLLDEGILLGFWLNILCFKGKALPKLSLDEVKCLPLKKKFKSSLKTHSTKKSISNLCTSNPLQYG